MQAVYIVDNRQPGQYYGPHYGQQQVGFQGQVQDPYGQNVHNVAVRNQELYHQIRDTVAGKLRTISVVLCFLAVSLIVVGVVGICYGAPDIPYVIPLHILTGILLMVAGICAHVAVGRTREENEITDSTRALMKGLFGLCLAGVSLCFVTAGLNGGMGVAFCLGVEYSRQSSSGTRTVNDQCTANKDENIAISSVIIALGVLAGFFCILVTFFFCAYGGLYGIKNNRSRRHMGR